MTSVLLEISAQDLDIVVESDNLTLEVGSVQLDTVTVPTSDSLEIYTVGPQGPPGPAGGGAFVHHQTSAGATWTITHNLGTIPAVVLILDSHPGVLVYTDVSFPDLNTAVVEWPSAETGYAYLR